jgi:hypothetical protein
MGCGASAAQVGLDDGDAPAGSNVEGLDGEAVEVNGIDNDLEVADFDRTSSQYVGGEGEMTIYTKFHLLLKKKIVFHFVPFESFVIRTYMKVLFWQKRLN